MKDGAVGDETRIVAALADAAHAARPRRAHDRPLAPRPARRQAANPRLSLRPVAAALSARLGIPVAFAPDCVGEAAVRPSRAMHDGDVLVLENVRFHAEEEANDPAFARGARAPSGDLYVNDAFGTAHRAHASTEGIAHLLPNAAGPLMEANSTALSRLDVEPGQAVRLRDRRREGQR